MRTTPAILAACLVLLPACGELAPDPPPAPADRATAFDATPIPGARRVALADLPPSEALPLLLGIGFVNEFAGFEARFSRIETYEVEVVARCPRCGPVLLDRILVLQREAVEGPGAPPAVEVHTPVEPAGARVLDRSTVVGCGTGISLVSETAFVGPIGPAPPCPICASTDLEDAGIEGLDRIDSSGYLDRLVARYPRETAPLYVRAGNHRAAGRLAEAIADFERCLSLDPDQPRAAEIEAEIAYWRARLAGRED